MRGRGNLDLCFAVAPLVKQYSLFWFKTTEGEEDYLASYHTKREISVRALGHEDEQLLVLVGKYAGSGSANNTESTFNNNERL